MNHLWILTLVSILSLPFSGIAKTVKYELVIRNQTVNMSGKKDVDFALTVNGGIPAPTLEFTEGDDAEITVRNELKNANEDVSLHWHGILLPPLEDGVPFVNTPPIYPGKSRTFKFPIRQNGTYWYHSHTMLQEQKGVFGAIVIHPKKETIKADKDAVVVISDWSDENADRILRNLKKDGDYYLYKKGTLRSYGEAASQDKLNNQLKNEWTRMGGMDLSDVGYDAFLINGKRESQLIEAHPREKVRLRIINASSSSYFHVSLGGIPMNVVSADGNDIEPIQANELLMGMAETYDVLFTVPAHKNYELRATVQDGTGHASAFIGMGEKVLARDVPKPDLYATMDHSMAGTDHSTDHSKPIVEPPSHQMHHGMTHGTDHGAGHTESKPATDVKVTESLTVDKIKALTPINSPKDAKIHNLKLVLDGDMRRYVWHINGKTISEDRLLTVNPGEIVRIVFQNDSMMHHPMHLHGHFFRVLNENGQYSPWKHTVDVPPMQSRTIEFYTDEVGQWMLHCHNLYHMVAGMARVIRYSNFQPEGEMSLYDKHDHHLEDPWYTYGKAELSSNHLEGNFRVSQSWNEFSARVEGANIEGENFNYDFKEQWDYEADLFYRRWFDKWTNLILGGTSYGNEAHAVIGVGYFWPMMIETNFILNHEGQFRLDLERKFQWTKMVFSDLDLTWRPGDHNGDHEVEYELSLMYSPRWSWAAGLMLTNDSLGAGLEYQF
ncbi:multicopper oxidase domain-containing protein [Bdellovibrio sp. HCB290]|uniref:multicopper oxidase domain-containing protein n=1 Tax=Bdellovibrio sp. HCB290 TaxID=3394356 RepID=UPI0039B51A90